ncbi:MAG: hypothetical protein ACYSX1_04965, partial [Planctomycetota bacterium]
CLEVCSFCLFRALCIGADMKVDFSREGLADALGLLSSVVPGRTPKPILRCVRITAEPKAVRLCATDLEVGINYLISEVRVEEPGEVVVPADRLTAVVREPNTLSRGK